MIFYGTFIYLQTVHVGILSLLFLSHFAEKLISNQSQSIFQAAVNSDLPRNATGKHHSQIFWKRTHAVLTNHLNHRELVNDLERVIWLGVPINDVDITTYYNKQTISANL